MKTSADDLTQRDENRIQPRRESINYASPNCSLKWRQNRIHQIVSRNGKELLDIGQRAVRAKCGRIEQLRATMDHLFNRGDAPECLSPHDSPA